MKFTDLLFIALSDYFLYTTQNQLAKFDTTPNEMRPSLSVINQENSSQSSIQANLKETILVDIFSTKVPYFQVTFDLSS